MSYEALNERIERISNYPSQWITQYRKTRKLTKVKFAEIVDVDPTVVWDWENRNRVPHLSTLIKLSHHTKTPICTILGEKCEHLTHDVQASQSEITASVLEEVERQLMTLFETLAATGKADPHWLHTGRMDIQKGILCWIKSLT